MKRIVRGDPLIWAFVCLIASVVAGGVGPDGGAVYLTALGLAAIALANLLWPDRVASLHGKQKDVPKP